MPAAARAGPCRVLAPHPVPRGRCSHHRLLEGEQEPPQATHLLREEPELECGYAGQTDAGWDGVGSARLRLTTQNGAELKLTNCLLVELFISHFDTVTDHS